MAALRALPRMSGPRASSGRGSCVDRAGRDYSTARVRGQGIGAQPPSAGCSFHSINVVCYNKRYTRHLYYSRYPRGARTFVFIAFLVFFLPTESRKRVQELQHRIVPGSRLTRNYVDFRVQRGQRFLARTLAHRPENPGYLSNYYREERSKAWRRPHNIFRTMSGASFAQGINVLMREYHYCSKPYLMCPCCWICCQIYAFQHGELVSQAAVKLPIAQRLAARGIHLQWTPTESSPGGLTITISAVPVPQGMQRDAPPGV